MKIVVPCTEPDLKGNVASKLGSADHVLIVDTDDMSFEILDGPHNASGPGSGVTIISLAVSHEAQALLVGYVAPHIVNAMKGKSIEIVTGIKGNVREAVYSYLDKCEGRQDFPESDLKVDAPSERELWNAAFRKGVRQFYQILPKLAGVIMLLGLFRGFVSEKTLFSLFSGSVLQDSIVGAALGSVLVGNPVNSYVIGDSLLRAGVKEAGVISLMMAWVTVGLIQLPVEVSALGTRFALLRNLCGFVMAVLMSLLVTNWGGLF
ncbi:NifB/NifX family molybdenum-iron cluster-binding protein [Maridesulfovibrio sp.]|uniref:NifB/NifX family molybdenum-iron cluster-binding protein n=1 Tax=Maridesulfovibrio sp. TaxID=2795000 RepID=UPI002A18BD12|nr:NifB/NifX family molybdenum-iron cluster-binding protein [Maridesulfovibrio sp.]